MGERGPMPVTGVSRLLARRRASRRVVREADDRLATGLYLASGERLWRHWREPVPGHLRQTKGRTPVLGRSTAGARGGRGRLLAYRMAMTLSPPWLFLHRNVTGGGGYRLAVAAHDGGVVLIDPSAGRVARSYGSVPDDDYVALRRRFSRHVPSPSFRLDDGGWLIEEYIAGGAHLLSQPPDRRVVVTRQLLGSYTSLVAHEAEEGPGSMQELEQLTAAASLPGDLRDALSLADQPARAAAWPQVPSQLALIPKNILIVDGRPVVIDLGNVRLAPFFYDPVNLVCKVRGKVLAAFLAGDLDGEFADLWTAAGLAWRPTSEHRWGLIALYSLLAARRVAGRDAAGLGVEAGRRWDEVCSGLRPNWS